MGSGGALPRGQNRAALRRAGPKGFHFLPVHGRGTLDDCDVSTLADVSMSLDNVLAVAGAAKGHTWVLVVGLGIAVVLMAVAAN